MKKILLLFVLLLLLSIRAQAVNWEPVIKYGSVNDVRVMNYLDVDSAKIVDGNLFIAVKSYSVFGDVVVVYLKINPDKNVWNTLFYKEYDESEYHSDDILKYNVTNDRHQHIIVPDSLQWYVRNKYFDKNTYKYNEEAYKKDVAENTAALKQYKYYTDKVWSTIYRNWKPPKNTNDRSIIQVLLLVNKDGSVMSYIFRKPISAEMKNSLLEAFKKSKLDPLPESMQAEFMNIPLQFSIVK